MATINEKIMTPTHERPCAAPGLTTFGWTLIGAKDHADALREAQRSLAGREPATMARLQVWDDEAKKYVWA